MEKFYKLINGENFVGVATQLDFRKYQAKHNIIIACESDEAQYISCGDVLYRDNWMAPVTTDLVLYARANVISITKEEYDILAEAMDSGEDIIIPPPDDPTPVEPDPDPIYDVTVEFMRQSKVAEMSSMCNRTIEHGVDVTLSDEQTYHFSLTTQDQMNLSTLGNEALNGQEQIAYHADGELCKFYPASDILRIVQAAKEWTYYHTTYFNSLQAYINALDTIEEIGSIQYGVPIPEEYQSEVLKVLLASAEEPEDEGEDI